MLASLLLPGTASAVEVKPIERGDVVWSPVEAITYTLEVSPAFRATLYFESPVHKVAGPIGDDA
ncbi:MAG: hypothetical protein AAGC55_29140, partial [Myxococcota bacterium]